MAVLARIAYDAGADPVTVLFVRFLIATACMAALLVVRGRRLPGGRELAMLVGLGALYFLQSLVFFVALTMASAGLVSLLLYLYPAMVTALAAVLFGERLGVVRLTALAIALAGSALTIGRAGGGRPLGIALGVLSAVVYAVYILCGSRVAHVGALVSSTVVMGTAAVLFSVVVLARGASYPTAPSGWLAIGAIAVVSTVVAIVTFFAGLQRIGAAEASTVSTVEPVVTVVSAAVVLGEVIAPLQVVGGVLILVAVVLLANAGRFSLVPDEAPPT